MSRVVASANQSNYIDLVRRRSSFLAQFYWYLIIINDYYICTRLLFAVEL